MKCDSCLESSPLSIDDETSLNLCVQCNHLLKNMALRPDMWQRLARILGPNHYVLHDDFYEDDGFPCASEIAFDKNDYSNFRINRSGKYENIELYLNDVLTRFILELNNLTIPANLNLDGLTNRIKIEIENTTADEIKHKCYHIMSVLPKSDSIKLFIKNRWEMDCNENWSAIASCAIINYSIKESTAMIENALMNEQWRYPKDALHILSNYSSEFAIDILLRVVKSRNIALMNDLGAIVRSNNPSWEKLELMINTGRPSSLMAIDALWIEGSNQYKRYFKNKNLNKINVSKNEVKKILEKYLKTDSAPRVRSAIELVFHRYCLNQPYSDTQSKT